MNVSTKTILAAATAIGTIGAAFAGIREMTPTVRGIVDTDKLPLAGKAEVDAKIAALATQLQAIQSQSAKQASQDQTRDKELAIVRQQQLETLLAGARADYAKSPTQSGRNYMCTLINQVDALRVSNGLPTIPPC